jgi:hypothetical protein
MLAVLLSWAAIGVFLGVRFGILALLPAILVALIVTVAWEVVARWGWRDMMLAIIVGPVVLQVSYLAAYLVSRAAPAVFKLGEKHWLPRYHL